MYRSTACPDLQDVTFALRIDQEVGLPDAENSMMTLVQTPMWAARVIKSSPKPNATSELSAQMLSGVCAGVYQEHSSCEFSQIFLSCSLCSPASGRVSTTAWDERLPCPDGGPHRRPCPEFHCCPKLVGLRSNLTAELEASAFSECGNKCSHSWMPRHLRVLVSRLCARSPSVHCVS